LLQRLREASGPERRTLLLTHLVERVRGVLGPGSSLSPTPHQKLFEIGLKSIDFVELKDRLERDFRVELPVTLFFAYSTLGGLTEHLLSVILTPDAGGAHLRDAAPPGTAESSMVEMERLARLEDLSDQDAERGLLERIADLEKRLK